MALCNDPCSLCHIYCCFVHILPGMFSAPARLQCPDANGKIAQVRLFQQCRGANCTKSGLFISCISQRYPSRLFTLKHDNMTYCKPQSHGDMTPEHTGTKCVIMKGKHTLEQAI